MNVTVFGATGAIGQQVVQQLRASGHAVTAYVRHPGKVPSTWGQDAIVVTGEITDAAEIDRAVAGADASDRRVVRRFGAISLVSTRCCGGMGRASARGRRDGLGVQVLL
jgi:putative NADH-flavin reductase